MTRAPRGSHDDEASFGHRRCCVRCLRRAGGSAGAGQGRGEAAGRGCCRWARSPSSGASRSPSPRSTSPPSRSSHSHRAAAAVPQSHRGGRPQGPLLSARCPGGPGCSARASSRAHRLSLAVAPTAFDLELLLPALKQPGGLAKVRQGLAAFDCWERDLLEAATASPPAARGPLMDEQVVEADSSTGALDPRAPGRREHLHQRGLSVCVGGPHPGPGRCRVRGRASRDGVEPSLALDALALGIVGTAFCVAVHLRAQVVTRQTRLAVDRLVDHLRGAAIS